MNPFEYVTTAIALILSFSLARTLANAAPIFASSGRYWVHVAWVVLLLVNHLAVFFGLGTNADVEAWTFARFCAVLMVPFSMIIAASVLVPAHPVSSYRDHMASIRVPFYIVWGFSALLTQPTGYLLRGWVDWGQFALTAILAVMFFGGAIARRERVDQGLLILTALVIATYVAILWNTVLFEPIVVLGE